MNFNIALLPGDGIGPEVVTEAVRVLEETAGKNGHTFTFNKHLIGGCSIDQLGTSLSYETLADCKTADAVLLGAERTGGFRKPSTGQGSPCLDRFVTAQTR